MREIWEFAKERLTTEETNNETLLCTDREVWNAWYIASKGGNVDAVRLIWELAK